MTRTRRRSVLSALVIGTLALQSGCNSEEAFIAVLCEILEIELPQESLSLPDGRSGTIDLFVLQSTTCPTHGTLNVTTSNPLAFAFSGVTSAQIDASQAPAGVQLPANDMQRLIRFGLPFQVNLAGTYAAELTYANLDANYTRILPLNIISVASRGTINVNISGLPAGVEAHVEVEDDDDFVRFTSSDSDWFFAGFIEWDAFPVTGPDGTVYVPTPTGGEFTLGINETRTLNIVYAAEAPSMGMVNLQITGLGGGLLGAVTVTGNGVNQTYSESATLQLAAGLYMFSSNTASNAVNDYNDPQPMRQVAVTAGQTTNVLFAYAIIATLVNINVLGLEGGLNPLITLAHGLETRTISANTTALKLAVGLWTIAMFDRTVSIRTYQHTGSAPTTLNVLAQTSAMSLALAYYCARWQWQVAATFGVLSDAFSHLLFINMILNAHLLNVLWQFPDPAPATAPPFEFRANQTVTQETVTITGQGAFVPVTGTRTANGALNLTGSGTVAGFPNVPVALTGTLSNAGALVSVQYRMGQTAAPTGLPGGPIIYSITAPAPPPVPPPAPLQRGKGQR